jgi:RNA polymerase sigma factor (sigma-70 family)
MVEHTSNYYDMIQYFDKINPHAKSGGIKMTFEEERKYILRAKDGDSDAWGELVKANVGLFIKYIGKLENSSLKINVSLSEVIGDTLANAYGRFMKGFDVNKNYRFATYIFNKNFICWNVSESLKRNRPGGINEAPKESCYFVPLPFEGNHEGSFPDEDETQDDGVYKLISKRQRDLPRPVDFASLNLDKDYLMGLLNKMSSRDKRIIEGIYFNFETRENLGKEFGSTRQAIEQSHQRILSRLKSKLVRDMDLEKRLG